MLKRCLLLALLVASIPGFAKDYWAQPSRSIASEGSKNVGVDLSSVAGGLSLGADFEYMLQNQMGVGGYFRYTPKNDPSNGKNQANGLIMMGASASGHITAGPLDLAISPGFGIVSIDPPGNASSTFGVGPRLAIAVLYQINDKFALGVEDTQQWVWFNSTYAGQEVFSDLALRGRYTF